MRDEEERPRSGNALAVSLVRFSREKREREREGGGEAAPNKYHARDRGPVRPDATVHEWAIH